MAKPRKLVAKSNIIIVGSLILMALVFGTCVASGEYIVGRRSLGDKSDNPKSGNSKSDKSKSDNLKSDNSISDYSMSSNPKSSKSKSGNSKSSNPKSDKSKSDNPKSGNSKSDNPMSDNSMSDYPMSGSSKSDNSKSGNLKSSNPKSSNSKSGNSNSGNSMSDYPMSGNPKSGNSKSGNPKSGNPKSGSPSSLTPGSPMFDNLVSSNPISGSPISGTVFDITKFGAVGDGATNTFKAFLNAWIQVCGSSVPATLLVPKGQFLAGPVIFAGPCKSRVTVNVQGTVIATTSGYASPEWFLFERVDNLILTGTGTFHGKGEAIWKADGCGKKAQCNLPPTSLKFRSMRNVEINGITSVNAKAFHMFLVKTENFKIHNIKLIAPAESPNTDGIHLSNADNISILNSKIATGDDCVSVGRGCNNVTVEGVICGPGHGLSVGSLGKYKNEEDVNGFHVRNCKMIGTDNGLRIKTWGGSDPSVASDITFEDIIMENVKNPIIIDQNYGSRGGDSRVAISNVLFKNVRGTTITNQIVQIMCSKSVPCKAINVVDVNLNFVGKAGGAKSSSGGSVGSLCDNANVVFGGKNNFPVCQK